MSQDDHVFVIGFYIYFSFWFQRSVVCVFHIFCYYFFIFYFKKKINSVTKTFRNSQMMSLASFLKFWCCFEINWLNWVCVFNVSRGGMGGWKAFSDWRSGVGTTSGKWSPHEDSLHCSLPHWCLLLGSQGNGLQMIYTHIYIYIYCVYIFLAHLLIDYFRKVLISY